MPRSKERHRCVHAEADAIARHGCECYKACVASPGRQQLDASALEFFRAAVCVPDAEIDLVEGALLIAQAEYPTLDRGRYRQRLEEMGREATGACKTSNSTFERLAQFQHLFFSRWGFHGNRDDYYDPRNSFLNDVLDRRTGIPITLSVVYMEVGRRAGLELVGVGMPAHFLVACVGNDIFVDFFSEGARLTRADCAARFRELHPEETFRPEFLSPVGPRQILTRLLNNLLEIYLRRERYPKALVAVEMILCANPGEPEWLRRRALVHYQLKNYSRAMADLQSYLERAPDVPDREEIVKHLAALAQLRSMVN